MTITGIDPQAHDEAEAALFDKLAKAQQALSSMWDRMHGMAHDRKRTYGRKYRWSLTQAQVLDYLQLKADGGDTFDVQYGLKPSEALDRRVHLLAEVVKIQDAINAAEGIWRQHMWPRYILCVSSNGHIHNYTGCHTLRRTSVLQWHPEFSGMSEADAVNGVGSRDGLGPILCTHCFPTAPVEYKRDPAEVSRERNAAAKAAERAEREAKRAAKRLTDEQVFRIVRGQFGELVETVAGCLEVLRREVEFRDYYGHGPHCDHPAYVAAAAQATKVLLDREAAHPGWGKTQAEIDKVIANAVKRNRAEGARI